MPGLKYISDRDAILSNQLDMVGLDLINLVVVSEIA